MQVCAVQMQGAQTQGSVPGSSSSAGCASASGGGVPVLGGDSVSWPSSSEAAGLPGGLQAAYNSSWACPSTSAASCSCKCMLAVCRRAQLGRSAVSTAAAASCSSAATQHTRGSSLVTCGGQRGRCCRGRLLDLLSALAVSAAAVWIQSNISSCQQQTVVQPGRLDGYLCLSCTMYRMLSKPRNG